MRMNESDSAKQRSTPAKRTRRATPAATPRTRTRKTSPKPSVVSPDDDQIRLRAYELYLQRNGYPGDPMEDWLRAKRELSEQRG
jgi:Protein of unknown function (DUF2934)